MKNTNENTIIDKLFSREAFEGAAHIAPVHPAHKEKLMRLIQDKLDAAVLPKMSETRGEYFKGGMRFAIKIVNDALNGK